MPPRKQARENNRNRPRKTKRERISKSAGTLLAASPAGAPAEFLSLGPSLGATTLPEFLATTGVLSLEERQQIVDQALVLIQQFYVHLPLKRAMHAVDVVQQLRLLRFRLGSLSERQFHDQMITIFTGLRDLHTNYILPIPFQSKTAFLPFLLEEYFEGNEHCYLVSHVAGGADPNFQPGVRVTHWNGVPIDRAVEVNAEHQAGSNPDARHARGLEAMTIRPMILTMPPDEEWVIIRYLSDGETRETRFDWKVYEPAPSPEGTNPNSAKSPIARVLGFDALTEASRRTKKALFAPQAVEDEKRMAALRASGTLAAGPRPAETSTVSTMPDVFAFRTVDTPSGQFGYIRIWTFLVNDPDAFVSEFIRIAALLPPNGLIVDVRGNGGGTIAAGERLLQVLTPKTIDPERFHFINTPWTLALCGQDPSLAQWKDSIAQSVETGSDFSAGFPLDLPENYNLIGQKYYGPVLLITDALCYSTTDIFTAGFQDHDIGFILGTSGNTGAGGANVWTHELLRQLMPGPESPIQPLPKSASFRVAIRRTTRVGSMAGVPVEDLGVVPNKVYRMTRNDLLNKNEDLINHAAGILAKLPVHALSAEVKTVPSGEVNVNVTTKNISRLDIWIGNRPWSSVDVTSESTRVTLPASSSSLLELQGFQDAKLVAIRRIRV